MLNVSCSSSSGTSKRSCGKAPRRGAPHSRCDVNIKTQITLWGRLREKFQGASGNETLTVTVRPHKHSGDLRRSRCRTYLVTVRMSRRPSGVFTAVVGPDWTLRSGVARTPGAGCKLGPTGCWIYWAPGAWDDWTGWAMGQRIDVGCWLLLYAAPSTQTCHGILRRGSDPPKLVF